MFIPGRAPMPMAPRAIPMPAPGEIVRGRAAASAKSAHSRAAEPAHVRAPPNPPIPRAAETAHASRHRIRRHGRRPYGRHHPCDHRRHGRRHRGRRRHDRRRHERLATRPAPRTAREIVRNAPKVLMLCHDPLRSFQAATRERGKLTHLTVGMADKLRTYTRASSSRCRPSRFNDGHHARDHLIILRSFRTVAFFDFDDATIYLRAPDRQVLTNRANLDSATDFPIVSSAAAEISSGSTL